MSSKKLNVDLYEWPDKKMKAILRFGSSFRSSFNPEDLQDSCIQIKGIRESGASDVYTCIYFNNRTTTKTVSIAPEWSMRREKREAFEWPLVRGLLEGLRYKVPEKSCVYENEWIRSIYGGLSNPKFVLDDEFTPEWMYQTISSNKGESDIVDLHGVLVRPSRLEILRIDGKPYSLPKETDLSIFSEFLPRILRNTFNLIPISERDRWREENVSLGVPMELSEEELDLFEAMGETNPIWWPDRAQSRDFFRSRVNAP